MIHRNSTLYKSSRQHFGQNNVFSFLFLDLNRIALLGSSPIDFAPQPRQP